MVACFHSVNFENSNKTGMKQKQNENEMLTNIKVFSGLTSESCIFAASSSWSKDDQFHAQNSNALKMKQNEMER